MRYGIVAAVVAVVLAGASFGLYNWADAAPEKAPTETVVAMAQKTETAPETSAPKQETAPKPSSLTAVQEGDRVLGNPDAPVTIIEYASLTCPHCATFHTDILPRLKKDYIVTGKAKLVFRDFPFDQYALKASVLARCADQMRYFGLLDVLFRQQEKWTHATNPEVVLKQLGALAGVSPEQYSRCLADKDLESSIVQGRLDAEKELRINSTPTFIIQGVERIEGVKPYDVYTTAIDRYLKKP